MPQADDCVVGAKWDLDDLGEIVRCAKIRADEEFQIKFLGHEELITHLVNRASKPVEKKTLFAIQSKFKWSHYVSLKGSRL